MCATQSLYGVSLSNMRHIPMNIGQIMRFCPARNRSCELRHLTRWVNRHSGSLRNLLNNAPDQAARTIIQDCWDECERDKRAHVAV